MPLGFPRTARLTRSSEFARVRTAGRSAHGKFMVVGYLPHPEPTPSRIGFITSKRVGGAVERNRARRRLREVVRADRPQLVADHWIVIVAKAPAAVVPFPELLREWRYLAKRAGLLVLDPS